MASALMLLLVWEERSGRREASWKLGCKSCKPVGVFVWLARYFCLSFFLLSLYSVTVIVTNQVPMRISISVVDFWRRM